MVNEMEESGMRLGGDGEIEYILEKFGLGRIGDCVNGE